MWNTDLTQEFNETEPCLSFWYFLKRSFFATNYGWLQRYVRLMTNNPIIIPDDDHTPNWNDTDEYDQVSFIPNNASL